MKTYTQEQLAEILEKHLMWLDDEEGGERANLRGANLSGAYLVEISSLWGASGNCAEIKAIQCDLWPVTYTAKHMQIEGGSEIDLLGHLWVLRRQPGRAGQINPRCSFFASPSPIPTRLQWQASGSSSPTTASGGAPGLVIRPLS